MASLINFAPLLIFFICYKLRNIYFATGALMIGMVAVCLLEWIRTRRVSSMQWISTVLVLIFGALTLSLHDARFLKWKPTVFMWLLALGFLASQWWGEKPLAQRMLQAALPAESTLPRGIWIKANLQWVVVYAVLGAANLWVAFHLPEPVWVNFKVYGLTVALMAAAMVQAWWLTTRSQPSAPQ
jgi:intracellular septation protein